ncbi:RDD family protein [Streptomyces sp. NA04227]|uniref:RDD family protein n=1 Tax=Streptomyces sp. NA04227 TaxID=2742136 RepID=UPI00158FC7DD|nr:RDD family protein [Streptomyces sp. NA04227]QKW06093.1 RDD family protein [Streptomyces sp. NA04227]
MDKRQAMGSRPSGPGEAAEGTDADFGYRGQQLGLPQEGPGSIAPLGRRFGAVFVDWGLCVLIAYGLLAQGDMQVTGRWAIGILFLLGTLTVGTVGFTPGKRLFRLRVISIHGESLGLGRAALRTALLCLAVPALIWDRDSRGLHDRLANAIQVRM